MSEIVPFALTSERRCDTCGGPMFAVAPGCEEVRDLFVLARGVSVRCWCEACWRERFGQPPVEDAA